MIKLILDAVRWEVERLWDYDLHVGVIVAMLLILVGVCYV